MSERLVEYLVVAGAGKADPRPTTPPDQSGVVSVVEIEACVHQRFPLDNKPGFPLPYGIERFCRPQGWFLTSHASPPSFTNLVLTSETGSRLYCTSLNFHQPSSKMAARQRQRLQQQQQIDKEKEKEIEQEQDELDMPPIRRGSSTGSGSRFSERRRKAFKKKEEEGVNLNTSSISISSIDINLDEENEVRYSLDVILDPEELYEPISLCLVSKFPMYDALQALVKSLYIYWSELNTLRKKKSQTLEELIAELLVDLRFPISNKPPLKRSFGPLKELVLPTFNSLQTLSYTSTDAYFLLKALGVNGLVQLWSVLLVDGKILFLSSSVTALSSAMTGLMSITYPLGSDHFTCFVVPRGLVEYIQSITPFIMGLHKPLLEELDEEPLDVAIVDIDSGEIRLPEIVELPVIPSDLLVLMKTALSRILDPSYEYRDNVFRAYDADNNTYFKDKAVRAVFINVFLYLLGTYQYYVTVVRFHPEPKFQFDSNDFISCFCVGEDSDTWRTFMESFCRTIGFVNFTKGDRVIPYRFCDFFDELVDEYCSQFDFLTLERLCSNHVINSLADRMIKLLPPSVQNGGEYSYNQQSMAVLGEGSAQYRFPEIKVEEFKTIAEDLELRWKGQERNSPVQAMSNVPLLQSPGSKERSQLTLTRSLTRSSSSVLKDVDTLNKFLDAVFNSRILEARKYFPTVTLSLRANTTVHLFVPELVNRLIKNGAFLTSEQFEVLVRVMNIVLMNEKMAVQILPLTTVIYQEVQPGVSQYIYTCLQTHQLWSNVDFWCNALYHAVQAELVRVYAEAFIPYGRSSSFGRQNRIEETIEEDDYLVELEEQEKNNEVNIGEITLRHRQRIQTVAPNVARTTARRVALSKNARMRIRASMTIPGASEGVLPPNAKPVTAQEALHHLAKRLRIWSTLHDEEQEELTLQEENAIRNQIVLFVNRMINMKTPLEFTDREEKAKFVTKLTDFIDKFLSFVDSDLNINYKRHSAIMEQVEAMIEVHLNSLDNLRRILKRSPTAKARVFKPPLLPGEHMILEAIHAYLLPDGRDIGTWVPADGHIFVTSYRIIFLGSPWDPDVDPNILVTRSMPVSSIYRMKELTQIPTSPTVDYVTTRGLQIRSTTSELIRLGFDDDTSLVNFKTLYSKLQQLRNPNDITLGIKDQHMFQFTKSTCEVDQKERAFTASTVSVNKDQKYRGKRRLSEDTQGLEFGKGPTHYKFLSDLSQSPYCQEYDRLGLGSLNFNVSKNSGPWRLSTINTSFTVCPSYPSVWVIAEKFSDDSLARIASQFTSNRLPVVTWKHPKSQGVLLRSASFISSNPQRKKGSIYLHHGGKNTPNQKTDINAKGILSIDVEAFITTVVNACPQVEDIAGLSGSFSQEMSIPPMSLLFAPDGITSQSSLTNVSIPGLLSQSGVESQNGDKNVAAKYQYSLYASTEHIYDWESVNVTPEYIRTISDEQPMTLSTSDLKRGKDWEEMTQPTSLYTLTSLAPLSILPESDEEDDLPRTSSIDETPEERPVLRQSSRDVGEVFGRGINKKQKRRSSHVNFASLPTAPRDWVVMDALQDEIMQWKSDGLYIIGEKRILGNISPNVYPGCTLLPVEVSQFSDVANSFTKLIRACAPSGTSVLSSHHPKYLSIVEESEWLNQISSLIQLSAAIADLLDAQGSSVLVCLEEGFDATAQVVSLAQVLLDPYYRTVGGFRALLEKDWLAFGHPFTRRGKQMKGSDQNQFSPVFLQFLDCVHQIHRQFPLSFEFNDFYLRTLAYHHCSMRFHTFTLDTEKERCARNWLPYRPRPPSTYGDTLNQEPHASLWEYIDQLNTHSTMFYNFLYCRKNDDEMLCPHAYQANLDIWSFYRDNPLSAFPSYDVELISDGPLTYTDLHYNVFQWDSTLAGIGLPIDPPPEVASEISQLLKQYTGLMNTLAVSVGYPLATWKELWDELESEQNGEDITPPDLSRLMSVVESLNERTLKKTAKIHSQSLHKTTSLAVLIKGKLSVQMEEHNTPHGFTSFKIGRLQYECSYCHHIVRRDTEAYKCKECGCVCHVHCRNSMPRNCGSNVEVVEGGGEKEERKKVSYLKKKSKGDGPVLHECEGFLYKKGGIVKNWKSRYFVLDLEKKHLAYHESDKPDSKLCGKISLPDIARIEECDPQQVPNTILQAGQVGYFFQVTTHGRVFQLMTQRATTRSVWIQKISTCIQK